MLSRENNLAAITKSNSKVKIKKIVDKIELSASAFILSKDDRVNLINRNKIRRSKLVKILINNKLKTAADIESEIADINYNSRANPEDSSK